MKKLFLVFALAALLLLAGCIELPGKPTGEKETGTQAGGEEQTQGGEQGTGEQQEQGGEEQQGTGGEQAGGQQQNYDEMTMGALMNLGVPIKCVLNYNYAQEGMSGIVTEYISGKNIRMESQATTSEGTTSSIVVAKEDGMYIGTTQEMKTEGGMYANCDWLFYPAGEEQTTTGYEINEEESVGATYEKLGYEYTFHCEPAMFGEEKFATSGNVCNIEEMMSNVCASITDPDARAQCEAAYG